MSKKKIFKTTVLVLSVLLTALQSIDKKEESEPKIE